MDNVLDVAALLEDAENRGGMLDHVDDLQDHNTQVSQERQKREKKTSVSMITKGPNCSHAKVILLCCS